MILKPTPVRLLEDDLERAHQEAEALGVSVGVYLWMLFRQSLRNTPDPLALRDAQAPRRGAEGVWRGLEPMFTEPRRDYNWNILGIKKDTCKPGILNEYLSQLVKNSNKKELYAFDVNEYLRSSLKVQADQPEP